LNNTLHHSTYQEGPFSELILSVEDRRDLDAICVICFAIASSSLFRTIFGDFDVDSQESRVEDDFPFLTITFLAGRFGFIGFIPSNPSKILAGLIIVIELRESSALLLSTSFGLFDRLRCDLFVVHDRLLDFLNDFV